MLERLYRHVVSDVAFADELVTTAQATQQPSFAEQLIPLLVIGLVMYLLIIRPQAKKAKEHMSLLQSLKPGDEVVTSGGLIGRVKSTSDKIVQLDLGSTTIKVVKENIARVSQDLTVSAAKKS